VKQRDIFLSGEGDRWFDRNHDLVNSRAQFPITYLMKPYLEQTKINNFTFIEIGCGLGKQTFEIAKTFTAHGFGIDPSEKAIHYARNTFEQHNNDEFSTAFSVGTSDSLDFPDNSFDLVYFGFCLYLVDRELLSTSISEACRVLKPLGYVAILDFDFGEVKENSYVHDSRIKAYKDDYARYFTNLNIVLKTSLLENGAIGFDDNPENRIGFHLLKAKG
jgi:ubiquinone/menaquinone biosynthesis C-methylase UbiE